VAFWIHLAAAKHPDRVAIEGPERNITYAELSSAAILAAGALQQLGAGAGSRVALALAAGEELVVALHGCLLAGAVAVPVDLRLTAAERDRSLAGASIVVSEPLRGSPPARAAAARGDAPLRGSSPARAAAARGDPPLRGSSPARAAADRGDPPLRGSPPAWAAADGVDTPLAVMHTSGTTAAPRAVVLTYRNWLASALGSAVALGLDPAERWLCPMPLTHVGGLSIPIRSVIYATTAVLHGRFDTGAMLAELMDPARRITLVSLVPTMLSRLLDVGLDRPPTLRWALLGGGPITPTLLDRAHQAGVPVAPTYGMTETCSQIATHGWPLPGVELRIQGDGEIVVRGAVVAPDSLADDGWLHTGDVGRLDERSRLQITGRKSDTIVTGGENVAPVEVEAALLEHPAVADAAVFGRADPEWGEALVAKVVLRDGLTAESWELRAHCARRLAPFKVPKAFELALELPRTESGKLLRRELG
jgi:O-succinylbenzoic acid--CoA ligase